MKKTVVSLVIVVLIVGLGYSVFGPKNNGTKNTNNNSQTGVVENVKIVVSYDGQEGKTVLDILKNGGNKVETKNSSMGDYVVKIDDKPETDNGKFWSYFINGQAGTVGADKYVTKSTDKVEWKLE